MNVYKIEAGTAQHIGNRPEQTNRVALFTGARSPGYMMAVLADGVTGGSSASDQVLVTAKQQFDLFKPGDDPSIERLQGLLRDIVLETHTMLKLNAVTSQSEAHSTFVGLIITPKGTAVWAHVGDSRLYRFVRAECVVRTSDVPYIEHLVGTDKLPLEAAKNHRHSKLLFNVLGNSRKEPFVAVGHHENLAAGETFLLASDGLWHFFTDSELGAATSKNTPRQASELLINKAVERAQGKGGNCSMAIVKLVKPPKEVPNYTVERMRRAV